MADVDITTGGNSAKALEEYAKRVKNLLDEQDALKDDLKELKQEIKGAGFDQKALLEVVKRLREDDEKKAKRKELEAQMELYMMHLGML